MHKSKVEAVYRMLGCCNSDIARVLNCSPSDISRVRTGSRACKPTSRPVLRFAEGLYLYADRTGTLNSLCKLCGAGLGSREEVVPQLIAWLFDADAAELPDLSYIEQRARSVKKQKRLFFGEKLGRVMELTAVSNMRLARALNTDSSVISRFRSGLRIPKPPMDTLLAAALYDRAEQQSKLPALARLCGDGGGTVDLAAFTAWLYDDSSVDIGGVDKLLDSIERFSLREGVPPVDPAVFAAEEPAGSRAAYIGIEGLREAVLRFLCDAARSGGELFLYSDQDMAWMVSDPAYRGRWLALMTACIRAGVRIRIIHNIDRGSGEMLDAIQSWMPLYITGMIEPYVCRLGRDARFAKTLFVRKNGACIVASVLRGREQMGYYEYVTQPERLAIHTGEFEALLANSAPLLNIYFHDYTPAAEGSRWVKCLLPGLSLGSLPADALESMLARAALTEPERGDVRRAWQEKKALLDRALEAGTVREFVCLPSDEDLFGGRVRLAVPRVVCAGDLYYTPEEYAAHVAAVMKLLENPHYDLVILPEMPFSQLQIIAAEGSTAVTRTGELYAAFVFSEPRLLRAFAEYFSLLEAQYRGDRSTAKRSLLRFL